MVGVLTFDSQPTDWAQSRPYELKGRLNARADCCGGSSSGRSADQYHQKAKSQPVLQRCCRSCSELARSKANATTTPSQKEQCRQHSPAHWCTHPQRTVSRRRSTPRIAITTTSHQIPHRADGPWSATTATRYTPPTAAGQAEDMGCSTASSVCTRKSCEAKAC